MPKPQTAVDWLCKDKHGKYAIGQFPNSPLIGFIVAQILATIIKNQKISAGFDNLGTAFIFTWAYLEITEGSSEFRRILGAIVMFTTVTTFFGS